LVKNSIVLILNLNRTVKRDAKLAADRQAEVERLRAVVAAQADKLLALAPIAEAKALLAEEDWPVGPRRGLGPGSKAQFTGGLFDNLAQVIIERKLPPDAFMLEYFSNSMYNMQWDVTTSFEVSCDRRTRTRTHAHARMGGGRTHKHTHTRTHTHAHSP
jgi:hypothetical protein